MYTILLTAAIWIPQEVRKLRGVAKERDRYRSQTVGDIVKEEDEGMRTDPQAHSRAVWGH